MLISMYFEQEYRPRRLLGRSVNTCRLYKHSIQNFGLTLGRPALLEDFSDTNIARHMQRMQDDGRKAATINKDHSQLLAIWRHACRRGLLQIWPDVLPMPKPQRTPVAWLKEDLQRLFVVIQKLDGDINGVPENLWWQTLLILFLETGERSGAVFQARWDWLKGSWIYFPGEARKGGRKDKLYQLTESTVAMLAQVQKQTNDSELIFTWPYHPSYRWKRLGMLLEKANLPNTEKDKFHKLRKTMASVLHQAGHSAQEALGHARFETTQVYLDPRFSSVVNPSEVLAMWLQHTTPDEGQDRKVC